MTDTGVSPGLYIPCGLHPVGRSLDLVMARISRRAALDRAPDARDTLARTKNAVARHHPDDRAHATPIPTWRRSP